MSRDKEFRRPKDAVRQPAGKTETDVRTGEMRGQDFDLRRARDAPVQEDNRHRGWNLYQGASEDGAVPATDSNTYAAASRQPVDEMAAYESADYGTHAEAFSRQSSGILTASFRTAAAFRSKTGRIFPGVTASAKAGSRIPGTVIPAGSSAGMQTFPGAAARSCPVPAVRRLPLLRRPAAQMPGKHRADAGCTSMATSTSSVSRRRQKPRNPRRNSRVQPRENRNGLPSWNLPLTSCHRRRRIKS